MNIQHVLDQELERIESGKERKVSNAIASGLQFIHAKDSKKLLHSLALRATAESINAEDNNGGALRNLCRELYNKHLETLPGNKARNVPHWRPEEIVEAIEWCKLNENTQGYAGLDMPEWCGWHDEISTEHFTIGELVELAGIMDSYATSKRTAVSEYLIMLSERKFKEACEINDKTSG